MLIDLDDPEVEAITQILADAAAVSPDIYAELAALAEDARKMLDTLEQLGRIRVVRRKDGTPIAAELLRRALH